MNSLEEYLEIFSSRFDKTMLSLPPEDLNDIFSFIATRNCWFWYKDRKEEKIYHKIIKNDIENVFEMFRNPSRSFVNKIDYSNAWNVFLWNIRLFSWASERNAWNFLIKYSVVFESIFKFFLEVNSPWLKIYDSGLIETRFKNEYPFVREGEVWFSSSFNTLWISFLEFFNTFCNRTGNIRFASLSQDLLDQLNVNFHSFFWDKEKNEPKFCCHPEKNYKIFSGYSVFILAYDPGGLIFKNRKKIFFKKIIDNYYSEKGIKITSNLLEPSLLPVFWNAYLYFNNCSVKSIREVSQMVSEHLSFIDPNHFEKQNREYERGMVEILRFLLNNKSSF